MKPDEPSRQVFRQHCHTEDEIDLLEVWKILARRKWLILCGTIFCTIVAVLFVLLIPREYRVRVIMSPPLPEAVDKLSVPNVLLGDHGNVEVGKYFFKVDISELYGELINNLKSPQLQLQFFRENDLVNFLSSEEDTRSDHEIFQQEFRGKLTIKESRKNKKKRGIVTISLEGKNTEKIADWLNAFVQLAGKQAVTGQIRIFNTKKQRVIDYITLKIESMRFAERSRRLDKIVHLEEGIAVAKKMDWLEQSGSPDVLYENSNKGDINMSFSLQETPLFLRGSRVLQAEIDVLKQRKDDEPFIPELRSVQGHRDFLSSIVLKTDNVHSMRIDSAATGGGILIRPKWRLIVFLGFAFGLLFSVTVILFQNMVISAKAADVHQ